MTVYRIYVLNADDRVEGQLEDAYPSDQDALERAEDLSVGQHAAEVWDGERLVGRLGPEFAISAD